MLYEQLLFHYQTDIKLNLIKIRVINFDFAKLLKILRVFADVQQISRPSSVASLEERDKLISGPCH